MDLIIYFCFVFWLPLIPSYVVILQNERLITTRISKNCVCACVMSECVCVVYVNVRHELFIVIFKLLIMVK